MSTDVFYVCRYLLFNAGAADLLAVPRHVFDGLESLSGLKRHRLLYKVEHNKGPDIRP